MSAGFFTFSGLLGTQLFEPLWAWYLVGGCFFFFFLLCVLVNNQSKNNDVSQTALFWVAQLHFSINLCISVYCVSANVKFVTPQLHYKKKLSLRSATTTVNYSRSGVFDFAELHNVLFKWLKINTFLTQKLSSFFFFFFFFMSLCMAWASIWPDVSVI